MKRIDKLKELPFEQMLDILFKEFNMRIEQTDTLDILATVLSHNVRCDFCPLQSKCKASNRTDITCFSTIRGYLLEEIMNEYPYPVNSIVNCGKRSFIIRDWEVTYSIYLNYQGYGKYNLVPILSRPIIDGVMQKGGHAYDCEKELIVKGLARLETSDE